MSRELTWEEKGQIYTRPWISEAEHSVPKSIRVADDFLKADEFYRQASEGAGFIYRGDFQNAKQLLQAVRRRIDKKNERKKSKTDNSTSLKDIFHRHRQSQSHKAQLLSRLFIAVEADHTIALKRAPDVGEVLKSILPEETGAFVVSLRELLGYIGAHEWRKKGVFIEALGATIHPHYGIFSPVRGEYLDLIASAPLPNGVKSAVDVGTGTGVIAAILVKRGIENVIATDLDDRALGCAADNFARLGMTHKVLLEKADLFPQIKADLIVCNPPWLPARATSAVERAVYDENSQMLKGFLTGVAAHLNENGEAWLIMSDLAEILELREPGDIEMWARQGGLKILEVLETRPKHKKSQDASDPLHQARSREITKLYRLKA